MDFRKLRYFSVLAEEKHFGRAARRLSLSQPPLSLAVKQLEAEIGAKLFERDSRNVSLTPAGEALKHEALFLLRRAEEARLCVSAWGLNADRRRGHRSQINKIKALDPRGRQLRVHSSISIPTNVRRAKFDLFEAKLIGAA